MGKRRGVYRVLVTKAKGKETLGRPRCRRENNNNNTNNRNYLQEVIWEGMDWIDVARDRDRWGFL